MPRMSDFEEFLNGSMVSDGDILVLLNAGVFKEPEETGFQRSVFQIRVMLPDKRTKTWTMNKTTRNRLAKSYGDNSEDWVKRSVRLQILSQNVRGEQRDVIYGYPVEGEAEKQVILKTEDEELGSPPVTKKPLQIIRFIKAYAGFNVEDVASMPQKKADSLIELGFAVSVKE